MLVAVSGGADSLVLLRALHALSVKQHWKLCVAHFNHQLRGRASDGDETFVRAAARQLALPFFSGRGDVDGFARRAKISTEMAARKLRHEFLARTARRHGIATIALAHHADDQVELFFLRLLRGAGGEGLAGMKWRAPSPADPHITLVRPLLGFSKAELLAFARGNKIRFRQDATNFSTDHLRNRIRNELLPLLQKKYQPGLSKSVLRLMEIIGAEAELVGEVAQAWHVVAGRRRGDASQTEKAASKPTVRKKLATADVVTCSFEQLPPAVQRRVLQLRLVELGIPLDFELIEQLRASAGSFVSVGTGLTVARTAAGTLICREPCKEEFKSDELRVKLKRVGRSRSGSQTPRGTSESSGRAGRVSFAGHQFRWQIQPQRKSLRPRPKPGSEWFDADLIGSPIILRHWRPGDRFQPSGLKSPAKLQDLFVNAKIPAARRRELVLAATAAGDIFWVEGLRIGEKFKLTGRTKRRLVWEWT